MAIIERYRVLRPNTRKPNSLYRIKDLNVNKEDILRLSIYDGTRKEKPDYVFEIAGSELLSLKNIRFRVTSHNQFEFSPKIVVKQIL